jgi:hypothetical protein
MTFGLESHVEVLNVASRRSKSPLSHGLHDGWQESAAVSTALVLREGWQASGATWEDPTLDTWSPPNQSILATLVWPGGDEGPAELRKGTNKGASVQAENRTIYQHTAKCFCIYKKWHSIV